MAFLTRPNSGTLTEYMRLGSSGRLGSGTSDPASLLHVFASDSGATPGVDGDDFFIESSGSAGMTIGAGTGSASSIFFSVRF